MSYIAINLDTCKVVAKGTLQQVSNVAYVYYEDAAYVVGGASESSTYTVLDHVRIREFWRNLTGIDTALTEYKDILAACKEVVLSMADTQMDWAALEAYASSKAAAETASRLEQERPADAPTKVKAQKVQRAPRESTGSSEIPKRPGGGVTLQVWEIADKVTAGRVPDKALKAEVVNACVEAGVNPATAQVQFGKWLKAASSQS